MVAHGTKAAFRFKEGSDLFTPKDLIELSRPGAGVANAPGDLILVSVSKYSFEDNKNNKAIYIAAVETTVKPLEIPLTKGGQAFWLAPRVIAHVVPNEETKVQDVYAISVEFETQSVDGGPAKLTAPDPPVLIGSFPTSTSDNFRYIPESGILVFSDYVYEDGELKAVKEGDKAWESRGTSALVYDETYVRHWDTYRGPKHLSLFSVRLVQKNGVWSLGEVFVNLLVGTTHSSPVEPFGGKDDFDVSKTHVVYTTLDPELPPAWHTKQNVYVVDLEGKNRKEVTSGKHGATHSPSFSNDGTKVAWTELAEDGYESDRAVIVVYDLKKGESYRLAPNWDRSPASISFSKDDKYIYLTAGSDARVKVFVLPVPDSKPGKELTSPFALTTEHTTSAIQPLSGGRLLYSQSAFTKPNDVYVIRGLDKLPASYDSWDRDTKDLDYKSFAVSQLTRFTEGELKGKSLDAGEEFHFDGAEKRIQGWILKPKGYSGDDKKKWAPLLLIHGGPQGAWEDGWSTRWNPNVFAQQGYFVIAINPTGSTTFGQDLTDAIAEDWGGKPFVDLRKGWQYILDNYPQIDEGRAVAAGGSYGGYAINWIQSNPEFGFGFKALVCHDGVFDSHYNGYSTDELFFFNHEFGGQPWKGHTQELTKKFSPSNHVHKWSTPELIIHGSKDYRLPETEGIAVFQALQQRGVPSRLVIFPDENHWVLSHGNSLKWHYEVLRWFNQFVGKDNES